MESGSRLLSVLAARAAEVLWGSGGKWARSPDLCKFFRPSDIQTTYTDSDIIMPLSLSTNCSQMIKNLPAAVAGQCVWQLDLVSAEAGLAVEPLPVLDPIRVHEDRVPAERVPVPVGKERLFRMHFEHAW